MLEKHTGPKVDGTSRLTVSSLSLNLWGRKGNYEARVARINQWLRQLRPDVAGFQECLRVDGHDGVSSWLSSHGYYLAFGETLSSNVNRCYGNVVASRWPIISTEVLQLPTPEFVEPRIALLAIVKTPLGKQCFVCTHLSYGFELGDVRQQQVLSILEALSRSQFDSSLPSVIVGDFNADPTSTEIGYLVDGKTLIKGIAPFIDAWRAAGHVGCGITMPADEKLGVTNGNSGRRIDYILVGGSVDKRVDCRPLSCTVVCNDKVEGIAPSDHFGLFALLSYSSFFRVSKSKNRA
jgi:endonuclease/exonuclease/phosphatase family metal-dependent hydrolase